MAKTKKDDDRQLLAFTFRVERKKWRLFQAICAMHDTTPTDVFRECLRNFIDANKDAVVDIMSALSKGADDDDV